MEDMEGKVIKICDEPHGGLQVRRRVFERDDGGEYLGDEVYIEEIHMGDSQEKSVLVGRKEIPALKKALTAIYH